MRAKLAGILLLGLLLAPLAFSAGPAHADVTHVVQPGDTVYSIARRYATSVQAIVDANGLRNPSYIWAGQHLRIPGGTSAPPPASGCVTYMVKRGDTLAAIGRQYGVNYLAIAQANGLANPSYIYTGQRLCIPVVAQPCASSVHVVQQGDTVYSIARRYSTSVQTIVAANGLRNPNYIWAGQRLVIAGFCPKPKPPAVSKPSPTATPQPPIHVVWGWGVRVVYDDNEDHPVVGVGSILQVTVQEEDDLPVTINLGEFYETSMPTGTKPEVGPYSCEFAPLQAGTWTITPKDLGISHDIYLDGAGWAHVEFYRTWTEIYSP